MSVMKNSTRELVNGAALAAFRLAQQGNYNRDDVIGAIKALLKARSGKNWSVTGGKGTAWAWISISVPPSRRNEYGSMNKDDREELGRLLGLDRMVWEQGENIAAGLDYRREYLDRAAGRTPATLGKQYWD